MKKRIKNILSYILLIISGLLIGLTIYIMIRFQHITLEQLIYSLFYSKGSSINSIKEGLIIVSIILIFYLIIILLPFYIKTNKIFPLNKKYLFSYSIYIFLLMFIASGLYFGLFKYIYYQINTTNIFDNYVNPKEVKIDFKEKKNLIYIFVESLEMSSISTTNGGLMPESFIPNLEQIALNNTNFSNTKKLGGAMQVDGVGWTVAGMVAQTSGIPLKVQVQGNHYDEYSSFLPGAYSIGQILEKNNYHNYIMLGSEAEFGGRDKYFKEHGNYKILDYKWAKKEKLIPKDYYKWWGYEDSKLFNFARKELIEISKNKEPFNFTILTADTHFPSGYVDEICKKELPFNHRYANSFYCTDKLISEFINWLKEQDFYKNTVIIISGDHLVMQSDIYSTLNFKKRIVYNTIINSSITEGYNNKNRLFTTMDMYPTTLASIGAKIEGDRLGLGTNLYSNKKTLLEEKGYDYLNKEISKKSNFYNKYILGSTYKEMYKNIGKEYNDN